MAAAAVVVLAVIVVGIYLSARGQSQVNLQGVLRTDEGRTHVAEGSPIQYQNDPPSSGPHFGSPAPWGPSTTELQKGLWVHNLEHGGIVVLYDCPSGCPDVLQVINQAWTTFKVDKFGEIKFVATPYSGLPNKAQVAAVAWDYLKVYSGDFTLANLKAFYDGHVDRGPEDIP